jgi:hypothetical protein
MNYRTPSKIRLLNLASSTLAVVLVGIFVDTILSIAAIVATWFGCDCVRWHFFAWSWLGLGVLTAATKALDAIVRRSIADQHDR